MLGVESSIFYRDFGYYYEAENNKTLMKEVYNLGRASVDYSDDRIDWHDKEINDIIDMLTGGAKITNLNNY